MAGGTAEERQILVDLAIRQSPPPLHRPQEMASLPIPEELLPDIFLRLPDPADLVRASAACVSFRSIIADRSFLRQYRKLHAPPFLGVLKERDFRPAFPPHPFAAASAAAARAVALAADFSFSFLPAPAWNWSVQDIRDSRVLLGRDYYEFNGAVNLRNIVVCDPLHRQYLLLPPIPDEMRRGIGPKRHTFLVPTLCGGDKEEAAEETAFRVIWMAQRGDKLAAFVFSSSTGQWQAGPSHSWSHSFDKLLSPAGGVTFSRTQCAYGCFYWVIGCMEKLLVLVTKRMEFAISDATPKARCTGHTHIAIVEAGEGRPGMFVQPDGTHDLSFFIRRSNGGSSSEWKLEKTISVGQYVFNGSMGRHLFLTRKRECFSLDIKTFQLETAPLCVSEYSFFWPPAYSNFPPFLSSPTVASGIGTETETLEQGGAASSSA